MFVTDNGTQLIGNAMSKWAEDNSVERCYIALGKLQQNGFTESFNSKLRHECINEHVFASLAEARRIIETWHIDYDTMRPHSRLDYLTRKNSLQAGHRASTARARCNALTVNVPACCGLRHLCVPSRCRNARRKSTENKLN